MSVQLDKGLTNTSQYKFASKLRIRLSLSQQKIDSSVVVAEIPEVGILSIVSYRQVTSTYGDSGNLRLRPVFQSVISELVSQLRLTSQQQ